MLLGCCSRWLSMGCISRFEKLGCCSRWLNLGCFSRFEYLNIYATEQAGSRSRPNGRKRKQICNQKNRLGWVGGDGSGWLLQPVAVAAAGCCSRWLLQPLTRTIWALALRPVGIAPQRPIYS